MKRRSEQTMMDLILTIAKEDERIRGVILSGSRGSPAATKDIFQDYDIVYVVKDVEEFVKDNEWVKKFGELLIMQTPDEMDGNWVRSKDSYGYLMQFKDWNRIDLTLLRLDEVSNRPKDSQSILLLDKDNIIGEFEKPSDKDYLPRPPTKKEFADCCNEFLWVSTYVAKGIWRKELTYAKHMSEQVVKEELIKLLTWYAAIKTDFMETLGYRGKYLEKYIEPELWDKFKKTYVDADYLHMWEALFQMCEVFSITAKKVSEHFNYLYDEEEFKSVVEFLKDVKKDMANR